VPPARARPAGAPRLSLATCGCTARYSAKVMGLVLLGLAVACYVGWHFSQARGAHRGIPVRKGQLKSYRKDRAHHIVWIVGIGLLIVLLLIIASHA
jgi:hypothetical protein